MRHLYTFGPLAGVLLGVVLSFLRLPRLAWLPVAVAALLVVSLVGAMWKALRQPGRRGEWAMLALAVPGLNALAAFVVVGGWPRAVESALPEGDDALPSPVLFRVSAGLFAATALAVSVYAFEEDEMLGFAAGAVGMLFFVTWLAASREAVTAIEALDEALGRRGPDPEAAEWARERDAVRAAFVTGGGADRAWAADLVVRHARRGEPEAVRWADALASDDPRALPAALAGRPLEPEA